MSGQPNRRKERLAIDHWLIEPMPRDVATRVQRMAACDDVVRVAVMPDVHLARDYCVGTAVATRTRVMPQAVGGDIGCGMLTVRVEADGEELISHNSVRNLLRLLRRFIPPNRHRCDTMAEQLPAELDSEMLSAPRLTTVARREGRVQLGTLGRGNHFLEFQTDDSGALWIMLHSGSRALGQVITEHHLQRAVQAQPLAYLEAESPQGRAYLRDAAWASEYARQNRLAMLWVVAELLQTLWQVDVDEASLIESDHNHVRQEVHFGQTVWVHRKGAQAAATGALGIIPGSMGSSSYHVIGRGCAAALSSSSHGAGRRHSRTEARKRITAKALRREMGGVFLIPVTLTEFVTKRRRRTRTFITS